MRAPVGASALGPAWWLVMGGRAGPLSTTREPGKNKQRSRIVSSGIKSSCRCSQPLINLIFLLKTTVLQEKESLRRVDTRLIKLFRSEKIPTLKDREAKKKKKKSYLGYFHQEHTDK